MNEELRGLLSPVALTFDNQISPEWTVMEVQSEDTFAFLYAVSNALSMRGIYINRVKIRNAAGQARDQFFITNRWGKKISDGLEQERLRTAVGHDQAVHSFSDRCTGTLPKRCAISTSSSTRSAKSAKTSFLIVRFRFLRAARE
jgi:hypothetical protein